MDLSKLKAHIKNKANSLKSGNKPITPKDGSNYYVVLPGWDENARENFFHDYGAHYANIDNGFSSVVCGYATFKQPCPICDAIFKLQHEAGDNEEAKQAIQRLRAQQQFLLNVIDVGNMKSGQEPQIDILRVSKTTFDAILSVIDEWAEQVFDENNPIAIRIDRTGQGFNTKYTVTPSNKRVKIDSASVYKRLNNLDSWVADQVARNSADFQLTMNKVVASAGLLPAPASNVVDAQIVDKTPALIHAAAPAAVAAATVAAVASRQPENELMKVSADPAPNVQMVEVTDDDEAYLSMLDEI